MGEAAIARPGGKSSFKLCIYMHTQRHVILGMQLIVGFFMTFSEVLTAILSSTFPLFCITSPTSNYSLPFSHFPLQVTCTLLFSSLFCSLGSFILQFLWLVQVVYSPEDLKLETKIERELVTLSFWVWNT